MGNNTSGNTINKQIYLDVNNMNEITNGSLIPLEKLNIIVELTAERKGRSVLSNNTNNLTNVNIIDDGNLLIPNGSEYGNTNMLTTNFTQVSTTFNKSGENLEGLGLTDINIEFNSSLAPMIIINMVDVRGSSVFASGKKSKYNVFFDLPYPIFKLKVQGYYGKSVNYCLHLTKFTSKFNSQTGNFDIKCVFIGYTYAFLSDMLLGYIRGNVFTDIGGQKFKKLQEKYLSLKDSDGNDIGFELPTIGKYFDDMDSLNTSFEKMKRDDDLAKRVSATENKLSKLLDIRNSIVSHNREMGKMNDGNIKYNLNGVYLRDKDLSNDAKNYHDDFVNQKLINETVKDYNSGNISSSYKLTDKDIKNGLKFISKTSADVQSNLGLDNVTKNIYLGIIEDSDSLIPKRETPTFYPYKILLNKIDSIKINLEKSLKKLRIELSEKMSDITEETLGFVPTIRRVITILAAHVDAFYETIKDVSINAEKTWLKTSNGNAKKIKGSVSDIKGDVIYPWPEYFEVDGVNKNKYEAWLGNVLPNSDEVKYIEELLDGLISVVKRDDERFSLSGYEIGWYLINPLELVDGTTNPYKTNFFTDSNNWGITKVVLDRMLIFFNHTAKYLNENEINAMAKLEANNLFDGLRNKKNTSIYTVIDTSGYLKPEKIIKELVDGNGNNQLNIKDRPYFKSNGNYYEYNYDADGYIPLTNNLNTTKIVKTDDAISMGSYGEPVKERWLKTDSQCNFIKNNNNRPDTYIKFINTIEPRMLPNYGVTIIDDYKLNDVLVGGKDLNKNTVDTKEGERNTPGWSLFDPNFGCQVFYELNDNNTANTVVPVPSYFYRNSDKIDSQLTSGVQTIHSSTYLNKKTPRINGVNYPNGLRNIYDVSIGFGYDIEKSLSGLTIDKFEKCSTVGYSSFDPKLIPLLPDMRWVMRDSLEVTPILNQDGFYIPGFIFNIQDSDGENHTHEFDLFGSEFYYAQDNISKAFLFLHTLPLIQQYESDDNTFNIKNNIINQTNKSPGVLSNQVIQGLLSERSSYLKLPYTWILFIGGLLWRLSKNVDPIKYNNGSHYYIPFMDSNNKPEKYEYLTQYFSYGNGFIQGLEVDLGLTELSCSMQFCHDSDIVGLKIERVICDLPKQVKDLFITEFTKWGNTSWLNIKSKLEIVDSYSDLISLYDSWDDIKNGVITPNDYYNHFNRDNYRRIWGIEEYGNSKNFITELKNNTQIQKELYTLFTNVDLKMINGSWRIWNVYSDDGNKKRNKFVNHTTDNIKLNIKKTDFKNYLTTLSLEYHRLVEKSNKDGVNRDEEIKEQMFNSIDNDMVKLTLYRSIKSIFEKWVAGVGNDDRNNSCLRGGNLIDTFKFLDRDFEDIGDKFLINPNTLKKNIMGDLNQSFYDVVSRLLSDNYFNFIPLPNYINYKTIGGLKDAFRPFSYLDDSLEISHENGPSFVCVYSGQKSIHLDMGEDGKYPSDGVNMDDPDNKFGSAPIFAVNYGQENQNYFKDVSLDQEEFSETQESLKILDDISMRGSEINRSTIGQNLFNIYNTRSYSCEVEMLGDAMIQPMMYFQLNNIPMFKGAYLIIKVSHSIKPNHMSTRFKGVRIKSTKTKLIDEVSLYMNMLGAIPNSGDFTKANVGPYTEREVAGKKIHTEDVKNLTGFTFTDPLDELRVTALYGIRTLNGKTGHHNGVDFGKTNKIKLGSDVKAVAGGKIVTLKMNPGGYGLYMVISHEIKETGHKYFSLYGHLYDVDDSILAIPSGTTSGGKEIISGVDFSSAINKTVKQGQIIAAIGGIQNKKIINGVDTAGHSTGLHLHFSIFENKNGGTWTNNRYFDKDPLLLLESGVLGKCKFKKGLAPQD